MYKTTLSGQVWRFDSLKTLMAKASPARSGDALAGLSPGPPKSGWRQKWRWRRFRSPRFSIIR
jgi:hypothetical protein